jgi:conjugal transfer mating pair stabilization protein TraN
MQVEDVNDLQDMWENGELYSVKGEAYLSKLNARAESATTNAEDVDAAAYATIVDSNNLDKSSISYTDNIFNYAKEILADYNTIKSSFADCESNNEYFTEKKTVHVSDYQQCTVINDRSGQCDITHNYDITEPVVYESGPMNVQSCGYGCTDIWLGNLEDQNLKSGKNSCTLYPFDIYVKVKKPNAITKVTVEKIYWDDQMQVFLGPVGKEKKLFQLPYAEGFVPQYDETPGVRPEFVYNSPYNYGWQSCQQKRSWSWFPGSDITSHFTSVEADTILHLQLRVAVQADGEGNIQLRVNYDPSKLLEGDTWTPESCFELATAVSDGMATGSIKCTDMPTTDSAGCFSYNAYQVCIGDFAASPLKGISNICRKVHVEASYNWYKKGSAECYTAVDGSYQCITTDGGKLDTCQSLINSGCGFVSEKCEDQSSGTSGTCYAYERTYDCGTDTLVDSVSSDKTTECSGSLACTGTDCVDVDYTQSEDFTKVAALLNVAQQAAKDMECTGLDDDGQASKEDDVNCSLFAGKAYKCKKAFFGVQDCCEEPSGVSLMEYLSLTMSVYKADAAVMSLNIESEGMFQSAVTGYQALHKAVSSVISDGFSSVTSPITSYVQNIAGAVKDFVNPISEVINEIKDKIMKEVSEILAKLAQKMGIQIGGEGAAGAAGGEAAKEALEQTAEKGAESIAGSLGTAFTVVGYVYLAYQVAMLIIQTVYKCTEDEYELNSNRALKQCHYVGSYKKGLTKQFTYCCYNSPLARILQEQIQPQIANKGFGTAKEPTCDALSVTEFSQVDWSKVNLDEWIALMQEAGELGGDTTKYTIEALTGEGSSLDVDDENPREDAVERASDRLEDVDVDAIREGVRSNVSVYTGSADSQ